MMKSISAVQEDLSDGWENVGFLKYINLVKSGVKEFSGTKRYIATGSLETGKINDYVNVNYHSRPSRANMEVKKDDVIFAKMKDTEKVMIITDDNKDNLYSTGFAVLRVKNKDKLLAKYLYYCLRTRYFQNEKNKKCSGATQKAINNTKLKTLRILLPPIKEQEKLIKIFEKIDTIKDWRIEADKLADGFLKSMFLDMFGDPVKNPNQWDRITLGEACTSIKDGPHVSPKYVEMGVPFISVNNIIKGYWDLANVRYISEEDHQKYKKKCNPEKGDVLYTKGGTTGFAKYIDLDFEFSNWVHLAVLKFDREKINGIFLESMLNSYYCYKQSQLYTRGIANRDLVINQMKKIKILVPPIELQNQFAEIVKQVEALKTNQKKSKQQIDNLFNVLMQKAFKGELTC